MLQITTHNAEAWKLQLTGFPGDPGDVQPVQVFLEVYEGKLRVHVWAGESEDSSHTAEIQRLPTE